MTDRNLSVEAQALLSGSLRRLPPGALEGQADALLDASRASLRNLLERVDRASSELRAAEAGGASASDLDALRAALLQLERELRTSMLALAERVAALEARPRSLRLRVHRDEAGLIETIDVDAVDPF